MKKTDDKKDDKKILVYNGIEEKSDRRGFLVDLARRTEECYMKKFMGLLCCLGLCFSLTGFVSAVNWNSDTVTTTSQGYQQNGTTHYWSYGVRNASTYSYGYSNYFNSLNSHYSSVTYDGLTRRVSASAGKTSMAQVDSIQAQNGRSATCRIGLN